MPRRFGSSVPAPERLVAALDVQSGEIVVPHGTHAANALGLTTQVLVHGVYLESGRTRKLKLQRSGDRCVRSWRVEKWLSGKGRDACV
ncbi:DUF6088 family protein [Achromobacter xylosoxidans]|uniref:DUF6088 family protein n=1 Tax=Alcaligenes xylosoxydans xylosoxydans TaxID=85698 RepID=UPI0038FBFF3F